VTIVTTADDLVPRLRYPGTELLRRDVEEEEKVIVRGAAPLILFSPEARSHTKPPCKPLSERSQVCVADCRVVRECGGIGQSYEEWDGDTTLVDACQDPLKPTS
jgi:ribosome biogenesis protein Nip4